MPFYRINGTIVHMRGTKLPKPCGAKIGFSSKGEIFCLAVSGYLCDWKLPNGQTCDRTLCDAHAHSAGKNVHYCPDHRVEAARAGRQMGLFTSIIGRSPDVPA